jgi:Tol biopolymer transport system component
VRTKTWGWLVVALLAACGEVESDDSADAGADAAVDAPPGIDAATPLGEWGPPRRLDELCTTDHAEAAPTLRGDGLEIYFASDQEHPGDTDIYFATRSSVTAKWDPPSIASVSAETFLDTTPVLARDGRTLWFASSRPGGPGGVDIYVATRATVTSAWSLPEPAEGANSPKEDFPSSVTTDGLLLGVLSTRLSGDVPTFDIFAATRPDVASAWTKVDPIDSLNTPDHAEGHVALSDDRLRAYFSRQVDGNEDLFLAERKSVDDPFGTPEPIDELNSDGIEAHQKVSSDERTIVFTSTRTGQADLYESVR